MALKIRLDALQNEISIVERLLSKVQPNDILASKSLEHRLSILQSQLESAIDTTDQKASVALIFDGSPVRGSEIIDMNFASQALRQYQEIIFSVAYQQADGVIQKQSKKMSLIKRLKTEPFIYQE